jgi:hypothetical protein
LDRLNPGIKARPYRADASVMRIVLEWLGLVEPQRGRRSPVALPAWAPVLVVITLAFGIYALSLALRTILV